MANPAYVQGTKVYNAGLQTSSPITLAGVTAGNSLQLNLTAFAAASTPKVQSVTDNLGNVWKPVNPGYGGANRSWAQAWASPSVAVGGSTTVTVTFTTSVQIVYLEIHEISNAPTVGCSNGQASTSSGTALSTPNLSMPGSNELFIEFGFVHAASAVLTVGTGYTAAQSGGVSPWIAASGSQLIVTQAATSAAMTSSVSGDWVCFAVAWSNALGTLVDGTVVLGTSGGSGSIIGTSGGNNSTTNALVFDANNWTYWQNANASGDYVGIDCGAAIQASQVLISFNIGQYPAFIAPNTAQLQCSNDPTFASFTTLFTFTTTTLPQTSIVAGLLLNALTFPLAGYYRYYRMTLPAANTGPADLEFYGSFYSGVNATCAPVSITNFNGTTGGNYDVPVRIRMSCATTGVTIWYTVDGSTPSAGGGTSQQYTGPITISANTVVQAIAVLAGLSNSRVTLASYHIGSLITTDIPYEINRAGYRIWSIAGDKFLDPVGGLWYWYGLNVDSNGVFVSAESGIDIYSSADLRNWSYAGSLPLVSASQWNRVSVVYNSTNNNYVLWTQQSGTSNINVYTAPNPTGPWTQSGSTITTINGNNTKGDHKLFLDTNGSCYLVFDDNGGSSPGNYFIQIVLLNSAYTAPTTSFVVYNNNTSGNTTPFGQQSEGFAMFKIGSTYYWGASNLSPWTPGVNLYVTNTTGPLGTWSSPVNPFQPDANELTDGAAGSWGPGPLTPSQNYAFDSQTDGYYVIPGRQGINSGTPAVFYVGDRWDFRNFGVLQTPNDSFQGWRHIVLPVAVNTTTGALSISWTNNWTFDNVFPQNTGQPIGPSGLNLAYNGSSNPVLTWTNNQTGSAYALYLDRCTDGFFLSNVVSEVLNPGTTTFTDTTTTAHSGIFYRVRAVNASGFSVSATNPVPPPPPPQVGGGNVLLTYFAAGI